MIITRIYQILQNPGSLTKGGVKLKGGGQTSGIALIFPLGVCDFSFITVIKEKSQTPKGNINLPILEAGTPTSKNSREQLRPPNHLILFLNESSNTLVYRKNYSADPAHRWKYEKRDSNKTLSFFTEIPVCTSIHSEICAMRVFRALGTITIRIFRKIYRTFMNRKLKG